MEQDQEPNAYKGLVGKGGEKNGEVKKDRGKGQIGAVMFKGRWGIVFQSFKCFPHFKEKKK